MSVVVIGLNHRSVGIDLLERAAVSADRLPKALDDLCRRPNVNEAVVLSTCNRTEVYACVERFHGGFQDIRDFFCELMHLGPGELTDHLYSQHDDEAVRHLFAVAAGLESAVLGESEILGQVRVAWEAGQSAGSARSSLNLLFRHALEVGKRARTETGISRSTSSVSHAAIEMAEERLGSLAGREALVVGAGEMGEGMTVALHAGGVATILVANRTLSRAVAIADRVDGRAIALAEVPEAIGAVDVVLSSIGAGEVVFDRGTIETAVANRTNRPLLIIDIAVPRNVDPGVAQLHGVTLLDLDDLRQWAARGQAERRVEAVAVRQIVDEEVDRLAEVVQARQVAPLIAQLYERAEAIRIAELRRLRSKLGDLDDRQVDALEALTRGVVAKLLHEPSVRLKDDVGTPRGERNAAAVRDLFDLS